MKNKNNVYQLILLTALVCCVIACKKNEDHAAGPISEDHGILFVSPTAGQVLNAEDTLWIKVKITSPDDLHEYRIVMEKEIDKEEIYRYEKHTHGREVLTNLYYVPKINEDAGILLTVTTLDHNSNKQEKQIRFTLKVQ